MGVAPGQVIEAGLSRDRCNPRWWAVIHHLLLKKAIHSVFALGGSRRLVGRDVVIAVCLRRGGLGRVKMGSGGFRLLALTVDQQEVVLWILLEAKSVWVWWEADELVRGR